jgi:hypothetical protein
VSHDGDLPERLLDIGEIALGKRHIDGSKILLEAPSGDVDHRSIRVGPGGPDESTPPACPERTMSLGPAAESTLNRGSTPSESGWYKSHSGELGRGLHQPETELEQLAVDSWRTPTRVLGCHPADQTANLRINARPASLPLP